MTCKLFDDGSKYANDGTTVRIRRLFVGETLFLEGKDGSISKLINRLHHQHPTRRYRQIKCGRGYKVERVS